MQNTDITRNALRPRGALLVVGLAALAWLGGFRIEPGALPATPVAARSAYELLVTLETEDAVNFEYRLALSRSEFDDVRFSPKKPREAAIARAKKALAEKRGYFSTLYGDSAEQLARMRVRNVELIDVGRDERISILSGRTTL